MTLPAGGEPLPPLYAKWMAELLGGIIPRERQASCDNCAMCAGAGAGRESVLRGVFFDPVVKCCTYVPDLPNFLVGGILSDTDPATDAGRGTVERRIADAIGVTPLGLMKSPVHALLYRNSSDAFGRTRTFRCPHYIEDGGRCGVWRHRNSVCTTWFCKHLRGQVGYTFWRSLLHVLGQVEGELAHWCVLELQLGDDAMRHLMASGWDGGADAITGDTLDHKVDPEAYARIWGAWRGREHAFFTRCAELVRPLSWADVLAICGPEARVRARLTQESYRRLTSDDIPPVLEVGSMQLALMTRATTRVSTYSGYDPLDVPNQVMELLPYFDGRPTEDVLAAIASERGIRLEPGLVRKLVDFMVLVPAKTPTIPAA
jgi:hypothetical protein